MVEYLQEFCEIKPARFESRVESNLRWVMSFPYLCAVYDFTRIYAPRHEFFFEVFDTLRPSLLREGYGMASILDTSFPRLCWQIRSSYDVDAVLQLPSPFSLPFPRKRGF